MLSSKHWNPHTHTLRHTDLPTLVIASYYRIQSQTKEISLKFQFCKFSSAHDTCTLCLLQFTLPTFSLMPQSCLSSTPFTLPVLCHGTYTHTNTGQTPHKHTYMQLVAINESKIPHIASLSFPHTPLPLCAFAPFTSCWSPLKSCVSF